MKRSNSIFTHIYWLPGLFPAGTDVSSSSTRSAEESGEKHKILTPVGRVSVSGSLPARRTGGHTANASC